MEISWKFPKKCNDMRNEIVTLSSSAFTWLPKYKHFVAERSDFGKDTPWTVLKEGKYEVPYLYLYNPASGNKVLFVFLHTTEGEETDGEIEAWVFGPTPEECEKNPRLFGLEVHIIND
jgi:hypothetical protein